MICIVRSDKLTAESIHANAVTHRSHCGVKEDPEGRHNLNDLVSELHSSRSSNKGTLNVLYKGEPDSLEKRVRKYQNTINSIKTAIDKMARKNKKQSEI